MRTGEMVSMVNECRKFGSVVLVANQCVALENGLEALTRVAALVTEFGKLPEMVGDLPLMPREQDRLDIRKVLVERGTSDASLLGDLRHRYR